MEIGIIGAGHIGGTLARRLTTLGHEVRVANSRGPQTLADLAAETGATAVTQEEAVRGADLVVVAVPERAVPDLPAAAFDGVRVVDAGNYYPRRDGQIGALDDGMPSSRWVEQQLAGSTVVKAFNTMTSGNLDRAGRAQGDPDRLALPVAGDDPEAKRVVLDLVEALGFDAVDAGGLDDSWRQEPGAPAYGVEVRAADLPDLLAAARRSLPM